MQPYEIFTIIITLGALFSYVNFRFIKWPATIGVMALSLGFSMVLLAGSSLFPGAAAWIIRIIAGIDFHNLLMKGMLSFLLFAGSIHIDARNLRRERLPVIVLATVGILISTFTAGTLLFWLLPLFHLSIGYIYCLLFAALISPTDPVAVLSILKQAGLSKSLELKIAAESLFNDGVAVVVFLTILEVAQAGVERLSAVDISVLFIREAGGGLLYGIVLAYVCFFFLKSIDQYSVEVLITVATVMGGYQLAEWLGISGPLAMVVAGIILGNKGRGLAVSERSKDYISKFWELIDEMLNAILFMLMGFEMVVIRMNVTIFAVSVAAIFIVLLARWVSVAIPVTLLRFRIKFEKNAIAILTWGGLRGGLSVALALSLPPNMHREMFLSITYIVVIFSILVQGLSIGKVYKKLAA